MNSEVPMPRDAISTDADAGVMRVHVRELSQLFNSIDPSPFHEKDLDDDAERFIVTWAKDLPHDRPLALEVIVDGPAAGVDDPGQVVRDALHRYFSRRAELSRRDFRQLMRRGRTSLIIGLVFLSACVIVADVVAPLLMTEGVRNVFRESLSVGGWVAMWRPLEIFLYEWWPLAGERKLYDRLAEMAVRVVCQPLANQTQTREKPQ